MQNLRRKLPSPSVLLTFEAAARLGSFTLAGAELNVTQAAVSRQIAALEARIGRALFVRKHRGIELTVAGAALGREVSGAFARIADLIQLIEGNEYSSLTVSATTAFSHFWLMPRLPEFRRQHPEVTVRIIAQDTRVALNAQDVDGAFRFGTGAWNDGRAYRLFGDTVGPVCGAEYAVRLDRSAAIIKLLRDYPLIEHDYQDAAQTRWSDYQRLAGLEPAVLPVSVACSSYLDVVYSAMANQGIALGWRRIISTFLEQGQLVSLSPPVATSEAYHLVLSPRPRDPRTLQAFVDWVMGCAEAPGDP